MFVLIFILAFSYFDIDVEPRRHNLGFENDSRRPSLNKRDNERGKLTWDRNIFRVDDQIDFPFPPYLARGAASSASMSAPLRHTSIWTGEELMKIKTNVKAGLVPAV